MNRRELVTIGTQLGALASGTILFHSSATLAQASKKEQASPANSTAQLIESSSKCVTIGMLCAKHCEKELAAGNKEMAECLQSVLELVSSCENLTKLAALESSYTKDFAKLTAKICHECASICEKHAKHMLICKQCMDACRDCEKACAAV